MSLTLSGPFLSCRQKCFILQQRILLERVEIEVSCFDQNWPLFPARDVSIYGQFHCIENCNNIFPNINSLSQEVIWSPQRYVNELKCKIPKKSVKVWTCFTETCDWTAAATLLMWVCSCICCWLMAVPEAEGRNMAVVLAGPYRSGRGCAELWAVALPGTCWSARPSVGCGAVSWPVIWPVSEVNMARPLWYVYGVPATLPSLHTSSPPTRPASPDGL